MKKIVVKKFGEPNVLEIESLPTPEPPPGMVRVRLTSIGMNHADLMARRGEYRLSSGNPPFTPGLEGGGLIDAVGAGVKDRKIGDRVILGAEARAHKDEAHPYAFGGTYRSEYVVPAEMTVPAPSAIPDDQLGALWLTYLTAWGCLIWKQKIKAGDFVGLPAASSGVAMAAAQIVKQAGAHPIGLTTSQKKIDQLKSLKESDYEEIILTHEQGRMRRWSADIMALTGQHGMDVYFDPVASGAYLDTEIQTLAQGGTIWVYGLLGKPGPVDVSPLIRKQASIRGWILWELYSGDMKSLKEGYRAILEGFEKGAFRQHVAKTFSLDDVQEAHKEMEQGQHIGKLILIPDGK